MRPKHQLYDPSNLGAWSLDACLCCSVFGSESGAVPAASFSSLWLCLLNRRLGSRVNGLAILFLPVGDQKCRVSYAASCEQ